MDAARLLTPAQRRVLMTYARAGHVAPAAAELELSEQTVKNHLSDAYRRLGVVSGLQALYLVLGGDGAAQELPEASVASTAAAMGRLARQLEERDAELAACRAREAARQRPAAPPAWLRNLVDGAIEVAQLRAWSERFDAEAGKPSAMLMTAREWVELLEYYCRPGDGRRAGLGSPQGSGVG